MQDDLISIIVPVNNAEDYLDRCVESLVNQSYENIEIILVDNGSSDDSPIMCDSWTGKDIRVKVIHNQKGTIASAKNAGLDYANGEYITFVNANNFVDKEYVFTLLKNLEETHSDISICSLCRYYENASLTEETNENVDDKSNKIVTENLAEKKEDIIEINPEEYEEETGDNSLEVEETEEVSEELAGQDEDNYSEDNDDSEDDVDNDRDIDEDAGEDGNEDAISDEEKLFNYANANSNYEEESLDTIDTSNIKIIDKKKTRSRLVIFEGEDIIDYFLSSVETIKTASFAKLYRRSVFKKLRFDEDRVFEDEFIAHKIYSKCKKFVLTSSQLYYYSVSKNPFKEAKKFELKDLDKYYAIEDRYNYFKTTKWQAQILNQMLVQIKNIYCFARAGSADSNSLKFLKHKFKLYYNESRKYKIKDKCFRHFPSVYYFFKRLKTKNI